MPETKKPTTKAIAKKIIKSVLGQVPFTAELYWMTRHKDKSLNSRFSLKKLSDNLPDMVGAVQKHRDASRDDGKKIFIFATLHYWIEHAAVTGLVLSGMRHEVTLGYLPYHDWQNPISKFDLRRQNLYAKQVLKAAEPVLPSISFLDIHAGYKVLPDELQEKIQEVTRYDTMYTLQVEDVDENSDVYKLRCKRNLHAAAGGLILDE